MLIFRIVSYRIVLTGCMVFDMLIFLRDIIVWQAPVVELPSHGRGTGAAVVGHEGGGGSQASAPGPQEAKALGER